MACKSFWECLLKVLNFLFVLGGLAMIGYGVYLFVVYKTGASTGSEPPAAPPSMELVQLGRPLLLTVSLADNIFDKLPKACFGVAAFILFDRNWQEDIPADRTGNFDMMHQFLEQHWKVIRWVALGIVIFEAVVFSLALVVRAANRPSDNDSDDEYIAGPRQQIRQQLINKQSGPATGGPATGSLDQRPSRNDAWSTRMREKYGLDTSEFTSNPSESNRHQQAPTQPSEGRGRCVIM
ncbi:hypothetical protein F511_11417 [Dorcoceras hygrometricum]|uniref:Tobamovirus multiplication protein 2A n=1 Tax=Dorcoceras hygrometricum TaxID=472368 RepID=A0A2Z7D4K7_9LAMI|nr:hypothetical protein F511_11417 [Dorcoceras hygrometricum]